MLNLNPPHGELLNFGFPKLTSKKETEGKESTTIIDNHDTAKIKRAMRMGGAPAYNPEQKSTQVRMLGDRICMFE